MCDDICICTLQPMLLTPEEEKKKSNKGVIAAIPLSFKLPDDFDDALGMTEVRTLLIYTITPTLTINLHVQ